MKLGLMIDLYEGYNVEFFWCSYTYKEKYHKLSPARIRLLSSYKKTDKNGERRNHLELDNFQFFYKYIKVSSNHQIEIKSPITKSAKRRIENRRKIN